MCQSTALHLAVREATNVRFGIQSLLPGTNQGGDQTHRSEVKPRAFWGHRGFSLGRSRSARPAERRYPAVGKGQSSHGGQQKPPWFWLKGHLEGSFQTTPN